MANNTRRREQATLAEELQDLVLEHMARMLRGVETDDGKVWDVSSADFKTVVTFLKENGWSVDPSAIPESLRSQLTSMVEPDADLEDGVIPFPKQA